MYHIYDIITYSIIWWNALSCDIVVYYATFNYVIQCNIAQYIIILVNPIHYVR